MRDHMFKSDGEENKFHKNMEKFQINHQNN